ncbi:esterase OVCA2-like [Tripterygium wilfordii]|uniref:esterase OVCA2-like n=1 Tax=Tripterygium wilfordii TaxID=458696 RepID=UPI0018F82F8D|nr:esterase OVCA2-like [Tripterygium wilfordii]
MKSLMALTRMTNQLSHINPPRKTSHYTGIRPEVKSNSMEIQTQKKPRILCLHGFRTSGKILENLIRRRWSETALEKLDLDFLDGPFPAQGKSDVEGIFDPPYYEWYQSYQDYKEYKNFEECIAYIEDYMTKHGPFDGLLGFSQGALISAAMPGMQAQGVALRRVPKIKFLIIISGAKFKGLQFGQPKLAANAFSSPIECPSLHFIGETDFLKQEGTALLESFVDPVVIYHLRGHTVPKLDEQCLATTLSFIEMIQRMFPGEE